MHEEKYLIVKTLNIPAGATEFVEKYKLSSETNWLLWHQFRCETSSPVSIAFSTEFVSEKPLSTYHIGPIDLSTDPFIYKFLTPFHIDPGKNLMCFVKNTGTSDAVLKLFLEIDRILPR